MTDNELIAEFLGLKKLVMVYGDVYRFLDGELYGQHEMAFNKSWDWLMPVVEKINSLYEKNFPPDFVRWILKHKTTLTDEYMDVLALPMATPITEVYQAVIKFIKWYNENKKP